VSGLHLEGTVLGPQIDRVGDTGAASLIYLMSVSAWLRLTMVHERTDHFGGLGSGNVELEVRILLPVAEKQRKLEEEAIVRVAERRQGLGTRVAVESAFQALAGANELLPALEVVGVGILSTRYEVSCCRISPEQS
jgi:hypothetical protein